MDFGVLSDFNPWWTEKSVADFYLHMRKRPFFKLAESYLGKRFIVLIYGLRRVGKTTMLYQIIQGLIEKKTNPLNILYFSFDEKSADVNGIISEFESKVLKKRIRDSGRVFVFFDEIQKVEDWESKIKVLYDLNPNLKIFLSGSASVSLKKKSSESLAGRIIDLFVTPLSFREFLDWNNKKINTARPELFQKEAMPLLMDFLRKGGFPEITNEENDGIIRNYVKNTVLEKILYRDIAQEFSLKDTELLRVLLELFIKEPGMIVNVERLARDLGRNKITVTNYIECLKYGLLIREVKNLRHNLLVSSRKAKKIYPTNTAFCFAFLQDFYSDKNLEKIFEVAVASQISAEYYYKNNFEIDFVRKENRSSIMPIEVKHGSAKQSQIKEFLKKFNIKKGIVISKETITQEKEGVSVIPLWLFLLGQKG